MTKYESAMFLKKLKLPGARLIRFSDAEIRAETPDSLFSKLKAMGLVVNKGDPFGIRTEATECVKYNYPFYSRGTYEILWDIINADKEHKLEYLLYNSYATGKVRYFNANSYLLPNRKVLHYLNFKDKVTNRKAFEDPECVKNVVQYITDWDDSNVILQKARQMLIRASWIDPVIINMRIEWSYFKTYKYIFWQITEDKL